MSIISYGNLEELGDVDNPPLSFSKFGNGGLSAAQAAELALNTAHRTDSDAHLPPAVEAPLSGGATALNPLKLDISNAPLNKLSVLSDGLFSRSELSVENETGAAVSGVPTVTIIEPTNGSTPSLKIISPNGQELIIS